MKTAAVSDPKALLSAAPVRISDRIDVIDILRGFALIGILIVNMSDFNFVGEYFSPAQKWFSPIDQWIECVIQALFNEKFYSLFSFLFGLGFAIQMDRLESRGINFVTIYSRRLIILFAIGLIHGICIWGGDVLAAYAVFGFALLVCRKLSKRWIFIFAVVILLFPIFYSTVKLTSESIAGTEHPSLITLITPRALTNEETNVANQVTQLYLHGSYIEILQHRVEVLKDTYASWLYRSYSAQVFGMFLLGLYTGKKRIFQDLQKHIALIKNILWFGLITGSVYLTAFYYTKQWDDASPHALILFTFEFGKIMRTIFALSYAALLIMLFQHPWWKTVLVQLSFPGRMALTNYLMQSFIWTTIYYGYGFGLYGSVAPGTGFLLSVAFFGLQVAISKWWLQRFRFGPIEWLWRSLTYGSFQSIRV